MWQEATVTTPRGHARLARIVALRTPATTAVAVTIQPGRQMQIADGHQLAALHVNLRGYKCGYLTFCPICQKFSTFPKPVFEPQKYD